MSTELRLNFSSPIALEDQGRGVEAIREVLINSGFWKLTGLTVRFQESFLYNVPGTPALSFIASKMKDSGTAPDVCKAIQTILSGFRPFQVKGQIQDFSVTLPDGRIVYSSVNECGSGSITFDAIYIIKWDATEAEVTTLEKLQSLEYGADLRIKFASIDESTWKHAADANAEYRSFFRDVPAQWRVGETPFDINTRYEFIRKAWALSSGDATVAAVEHETGVEFLIALTAGLTVEAVVYLVKWGYGKWRERREDLAANGGVKFPTFIEIERITRDVEGRPTKSETLKFRGPMEPDFIREISALWSPKD